MPALVRGLNADDDKSKGLEVCNLGDTELYTVIREQLPIFNTAASSFIKNRNKPVPLHAPTLYTSANIFLQ